MENGRQPFPPQSVHGHSGNAKVGKEGKTLPETRYYAKFARIMQDTTKQKPRTRAQYSSPDCEAATAAAAEIICESFDGSGFDDYTDETI